MKLIFKFFVVAVFIFSCMLGVNANAARNSNGAHMSSAIQNGSVDINKAGINLLMTLKGIGPNKAKAIIAYRKENGQFKSINDLAKVKGFGQKRVGSLLKNNPNRIVVK